jgi:hypothetical protein
MPPEFVIIAAAFLIAGTQSGAVISVTSISPFWNSLIFSTDGITWTLPTAMPGDAGRP